MRKIIDFIIYFLGVLALIALIAAAALYFCSHSILGISDQDKTYISEAYNEARLALATNDYPAGAVITLNGQIIAKAHNTVQKEGDSRNHAEMVAINEALKILGIGDFSQATGTVVLYTSFEPCPMCEGYIIWKKVPRVVVGKRKGFTTLARENFFSHIFYRWHERGGISEDIHNQLDLQYQNAKN